MDKPQPARPVIPYATPEHPGPVLSYATPKGLIQEGGCWRNGDRMVVTHRYTNMPPHCFRCGHAAAGVENGYAKYHHPNFGRLTTSYYIPLCEAHLREIRRVRKWAPICILIDILLIILGIALYMKFPWAIWIPRLAPWMFIPIVAKIYSTLPGRVVSADRRYIVLAGAGKEFLDQLPEM